jgi:hypothetical protein
MKKTNHTMSDIVSSMRIAFGIFNNPAKIALASLVAMLCKIFATHSFNLSQPVTKIVRLAISIIRFIIKHRMLTKRGMSRSVEEAALLASSL